MLDNRALTNHEHALDFLWLELTGKCNLSCAHCYAESSPAVPLVQTVTTDRWREILDEAASIGCRKVQFIGGEPTLHPALPDLVRRAKQNGYELIEVYTNGTTFGTRLKQVFVECDVALAFSVYGDSAIVHDEVTGQQFSFDRTIKNLKWALAEKLDVRVGIIATGVNDHALTATRDVLKDLGVRSIMVDRTRAVGRGTAARSRASEVSELCGRCWQGRLCITAQGEAIPCVFARTFTVGTVSDPLGAILTGERLHAFRQMLRQEGVESDRGGNVMAIREPGLMMQCVPFGDPCTPEEGHPCIPQGGRPCLPEGGRCSPQSPFCVPDGGLPSPRCNPNARTPGQDCNPVEF